MFATTSDNLRIYTIEDNKIEIKSNLQNNLQKELSAPLTSFDWNPIYNNLICCSSIDTTCTLWDIVEEKLTKQVITHDKEVFDINFSPEGNIFSTVGADCTARLFDLRDLSRSDIIYENNEPLLRISFNHGRPNLMALTSLFNPTITLIDSRKPFTPLMKLIYHKKPISNLVWSPSSLYFKQIYPVLNFR